MARRICRSFEGRSIVFSDFMVITEKHRSMDLIMMTLYGARERTLEDFKAIFEEASLNFVVNHVEIAPGPQGDVIDIIWQG